MSDGTTLYLMPDTPQTKWHRGMGCSGLQNPIKMSDISIKN